MSKKSILLSILLISCLMTISCEKHSSMKESNQALTSVLNISPTVVPTVTSTKAPKPSATLTNDLIKEGKKDNEVSHFQVVNEDDIIFLEDFDIPDFEVISTEENSAFTQSRGFFAGTDTNWYTIENDGIIYFYYQFLDKDLKPLSEPTYLNYAIVGEQYILKCGIHIGMTKEEVYALLPDCIEYMPNNFEGVVEGRALIWNVHSFPEGWCESYSDIIMADIEYGEDLPWYLGIMLDKNGIVKAITTCYPTAG